MIEDMLEIARLENKHTTFEYELVQLSALLDRLCSKAQLDMLDNGFVFQWTRLTEPLWPERVAAIYADPMRVEQVFNNLLSNARKFTSAGGTIQVDIELQDLGSANQSVVIRFIDAGSGILPDEQEHIFDRYYRGQAAKSLNVTGTGLGLPICREIMSAHRGELGLECSSDSGSTFYIRFPLKLVTLRELESELEELG